jgi:hypothetical protein
VNLVARVQPIKSIPIFFLNPLLKEAFELSKSLDSQGVYSWYTYVKNIEPDSFQINKVAICKNLKDVKHLKLDIKNEITEFKSLFQ